MKAGDVVDRIKTHLGVPWRDATYRDTFKSGGPDTEVTGIATTCFVTLDVIRKATAAGLNMIIPHEDTFWNDRDDVASSPAIRSTSAKLELLTKHERRGVPHPRPHARAAARLHLRRLGARVGLDPKQEDPPGSHRFVIPETTLGALAADVQRRSGSTRPARRRRPEGQGQPHPPRRRLRLAADQRARTSTC